MNSEFRNTGTKIHPRVRWGTHLTERKQAEEALRESEGRYHSLVEQISEGVWRSEMVQPFPIGLPLDEQVNLIYEYSYIAECNDRMAQCYGYSRAEKLIGKRFSDICPISEPQNLEYLRAYVRSGYKQINCETREFDEERNRKYFLNNEIGIVKNGMYAGSWGTQLDITERKQLEREILEISEREQRRIGQDLHDGLGQQLTGIAMLAKVLEEKLAALKMSESADAGQIRTLIETAVCMTHDLARLIYPVELECGGLNSALRALAFNTEKVFQVSCVFLGDGPFPLLDHVVQSHLYRIAQEAVTNAIKHSKSKNISIDLSCAGHQLNLTIRDDGLGLPPEAQTGQGMGLRIMQYRTRMIHGAMNISPACGGGTVVACFVPIE